MSSLKFMIFESSPTLISKLADSIIQVLQQAIQSRGAARMVVSGGRTPLPLFRELSMRSFAWEKVKVTLADERWVPSSSSESNERALLENLIKNEARGAKLMGLYTGHRSPGEGISSGEARLKEFGQPYDVVLLGMGSDGHFASLFPQDASLKEGLDPDTDQTLVAARAPDGVPRMSQTLASLLKSDFVALYFEGHEKRTVYAKALKPSAVEKELPVAALLQNARGLQVYWCAEE